MEALALIMGVALSFNILIILWKAQHQRFMDAVLDAGLLAVVMMLSGGSAIGMMVGTIASAIVSIYLLINRPDKQFTINRSLFHTSAVKHNFKWREILF